jgi:predicted Zn-dependent peptidase
MHKPPLLWGLLAALALAGCKPQDVRMESPTGAPATPTRARSLSMSVPVDYYVLPNGLKVVLSEDHSVPIATIAIHYKIGFRIEPRDRTGFAHLFEHMMFQGSANLPKGEFFRLVQGMGGSLNGSTRFDYTNYYETFPSNALRTILWAEADRMRSLNITEENLTNQKDVVSEEVKVNVLNQPYGGFPWLDLPQYANTNWYNAHNFYGDLEHIRAATLQDVREFFERYYAPNNAVLVVIGDFDRTTTKRWIEEYFGPIPRRDPPPQVDISEPRQTEERRHVKIGKLEPRPALAIGYHVPPRWSPEYFAFGLIDEILLQGEDSRLHRDLVQRRGYTDQVFGGINILGNMFDYDGPMLWTAALIHDPHVTDEQIIAAFDEHIERLRTELVHVDELARARIKIRSALYDLVGSASRVGLAGLLASFALYDNDPTLINRIEAEFAKVTPELIRSTAQEYLRKTNRTVLIVQPAASGQGAKR